MVLITGVEQIIHRVDLATQHLIVRHPGERPGAAPEVDQDVRGVGQRLDAQARPRGDAEERGVEPEERLLADAEAHRRAPDAAVSVVDEVDRRDGGRARADHGQRRIEVDPPIERLLVHDRRGAQHHVARARHGRTERLVVLRAARRRRVEDQVDADRERPARADPVE